MEILRFSLEHLCQERTVRALMGEVIHGLVRPPGFGRILVHSQIMATYSVMTGAPMSAKDKRTYK